MYSGAINVGSIGSAAGLCHDRAHFRAAARHGRRPPFGAGEPEQTRIKDIALGQPNWPVRATQIGNCYRNQFELPVLFYVLIAIALPIRHADLVIVMLSWVFVVCRLVHAGIFVSSNDLGQRSMAWLVSALVLLAMWVYFALKILLLI